MNRYEAMFEELRATGAVDLQEVWLVCLKCYGAFLGKAGDKCRVCDDWETKPAPLIEVETIKEYPVCDTCGFACVAIGRSIGRFTVCKTCFTIANEEWEYPGLTPQVSREEILKYIHRCEIITSLSLDEVR